MRGGGALTDVRERAARSDGQYDGAHHHDGQRQPRRDPRAAGHEARRVRKASRALRGHLCSADLNVPPLTGLPPAALASAARAPLSHRPNASSMSERYSFPLLPVREIRDTFGELRIQVTEDDLANPAGWKVKQIYEQLIELLLNQRREDMAQPSFGGIAELEFPELHEESVPMTAFLKAW